MQANRPLLPGPPADSDSDFDSDVDLVAAIDVWEPRVGARPDVTLEARTDGLRVKLSYLGVETGVLFSRGARVTPAAVHAMLDRVFDVLSWRVIRPPE